MSTQHLPEIILLAIGIMAVIKSLWGLFHPGSFRDVALWWTRAVTKVGTLVSVLLFLCAIAVLCVVLLDQPLVNGLLILLAMMLVWAGTVYLQPSTIERMVDFLVVDRSSVGIRILSAVSLLIGLALAGIALWTWLST